ncbi:DUF4369 domain-containing protein [Robiginitalea sp. IMCC43444]|uniref:DUF4369 domain-containing protein n=1 Tax=Robiginitalea sp. IMCC43444 TaxID=3459121 RepID=UPI004043909F
MRTSVRAVFFLAFAMLISCGSDKEHMVVKGEIKGLKKGMLYLQFVPDSTLVNLDSVKVNGNGAFEIEVEIEQPDIFYLYLDKADGNVMNDRISFYGESGAVQINSSYDAFEAKSEIKGGPGHELYEEYLRNKTRFNIRELELFQAKSELNLPSDSVKLDSLEGLAVLNLRRSYLYSINFAIRNKDSYLAPIIAVNDVADANPKFLDSIYSNLNQEIAASKYGRKLKELIGKE